MDSQLFGISQFSMCSTNILTLLHSERPKLHTILAFQCAIGLNHFNLCVPCFKNVAPAHYFQHWQSVEIDATIVSVLYAPVICKPGYCRAWDVPQTVGLKYHDFTFALSSSAMVVSCFWFPAKYSSGSSRLNRVLGVHGLSREILPENFPRGAEHIPELCREKNQYPCYSPALG